MTAEAAVGTLDLEQAGPGRRLGLVGENGIGRSTLLRPLSGEEEPDGGDVQRPADTELLRQELPFPGNALVGAVVDDALAEFHRVRDRLHELGEILAVRPEDEAVLAECGDLLGWAQARDLWDADPVGSAPGSAWPRC